MYLEPHDYRIYYVNIDLRHQYGISVAESQTSLLAKRPSAAMSEVKRLLFAGYAVSPVHKKATFSNSNFIEILDKKYSMDVPPLNHCLSFF